jgi:hypothetical protein
MAMTWQQAGLLAGGLLVVALCLYQGVIPRLRALSPFAREAGVIAGLYALWQLAGSLSVLGTTGAFQRARWIERTEHDWWLPSEARVQHLVSGHSLIVQASNLYYATMHFGVLFAFLIWLFIRHRDAYPTIRLTLVLSTLVCLLIQLVPVAPPRLLPGFVDTAQQYGQSVYGLGLAADELSAMPSVHVAWAVLVGWAVVRVSTSKWRWLAIVHPVLTIFVIVATANHFWLDGIVAIAVLAACVWGQRGTARAVQVWRQRRAAASRAQAQPLEPVLP